MTTKSKKIIARINSNRLFLMTVFMVGLASVIIAFYFYFGRKDIISNFSNPDTITFFSFIVAASVITAVAGVFLFKNRRINKPENQFGLDDYIYVELPDRQKSTFIDLVKGFEHYAKICAYILTFSYDSSIGNR